MNREIIGLQVLIRRLSPDMSNNEVFPGVITGSDGRGKITIRRYKDGLPNGQEFKAPLELGTQGFAGSRRGHLRFALVPLTPEADAFVKGNQ